MLENQPVGVAVAGVNQRVSCKCAAAMLFQVLAV